jgi:hypothetical protein
MDSDQVKQLEDIVRDARSSNDELAAIRAGISGLVGIQMEGVTGWLDNVSITSAMPGSLAYEHDCLTKIAGLRLAVAPVVAGWFTSNGGEVLVRRYEICPGEQLHRVAPDNTFRVTDAARQRFVADLERLADAGYMHAVSARAATHWLYSERTRWIILDGWTALKPLKHRDDLFEAVLSNLNFIDSR